MFEMNCTARSIGKEGRIQWQFNDTLIESCTRCNVQVITNEYDAENCSFVSTVIIKTFTIINQGVYTCNASQPNTDYYNSDSIHILIPTDIIVTGNVYTLITLHN